MGLLGLNVMVQKNFVQTNVKKRLSKSEKEKMIWFPRQPNTCWINFVRIFVFIYVQGGLDSFRRLMNVKLIGLILHAAGTPPGDFKRFTRRKPLAQALEERAEPRSPTVYDWFSPLFPNKH